MSSASVEPIWEVVRVHGDVFKYEGKKTFVVNTVTLVYKKNYIEHVVTIHIPMCSSVEEVIKEDLKFSYRDNMQTNKFTIFKKRRLIYEELFTIFQYYGLPDLTNFEVIQPFLAHFVMLQSPEIRMFGVVQKTVGDGDDIFADVNEMAYFAMDIYSN